EHDRRRGAVRLETTGDLEPVEVGQLDVEQDEIRVELLRLGERLLAVCRLADDREAFCLEQRACGRTEARVVVDDEDCPGHVIHRRKSSRESPYGYPHPRWVSPCHLAAKSRAAADSEPLLERSVFLPVLLRRPHEQGRDEDRDRDHEHGHQDLGREIHQISASGKLRCRRGGTRKFWRWVVRSTELKPWFRSRDSSGSFPSGSTPSIARRLRWKSSLVGLKTTKWIPAAGPLASSEG